MTASTETLIIIPARLDSSRLPGKVLQEIGGKPMLQHVYERASSAGFPVVVSTPDERIKTFVERELKGMALLSGVHENGTSRCIRSYFELVRVHGIQYRKLINVQGDEPMIDPEIIKGISDQLSGKNSRKCTIATAAYRVKKDEKLRGDSEVFVVKNRYNEAMYFSRSVIPFIRDKERSIWSSQHTYLKHLGIYGFSTDVLQDLLDMKDGILEQQEKLEQLKWLESGHKIGIVETDKNLHSVDTQEDLNFVRSIWTS